MKLSPLIVALDVENIQAVEKIIKKLGPQADFYKVGLRLFTHYGPEILKFLKKRKKKIFLDLKLHDIPNTVAETCSEIARYGIDMLTIHTLGGLEMLQAASHAVRKESLRLKKNKPLVMGVTVLTSMSDLSEIGISKKIPDQVLQLASLAAKAKLDGVICSPLEIELLRKKFDRKTLKIVTPGVRPVGSETHDQKRVKTPEEALTLGADSVVMGRPILQSPDPAELIQKIRKSHLRLQKA